MPEIPFVTPGPSNAELAVHRLNTKAFIAANPSLITLTPRSRQITGSGAVWIEGATRPPQVGRIIDTQAVGGISTGNIRTQDGAQEKLGFQLLLPHDGVVAVDDTFTASGLAYEVLEVIPFNGYEVRASVVRYG